MARTTAPLFSLDASGTIANAIVFSKWRGRQYVRRHSVPKNPRTPAQMGIRAMMKFLGQIYQTYKAEIDSGYAEPAAAANVSPFNSYVAYNLRRWRQMQGPTYRYPAEVTAFSTTITQVLDGGPRNVLVTAVPSDDAYLWAVAIFRGTEAIATVNWNLCVAVLPITTDDPVTFTDGPLVPGTYHYRTLAIQEFGNLGTACSDDEAIASA
jgi:hypothetical protein